MTRGYGVQSAERRRTDERNTNHQIGFRYFLSAGTAILLLIAFKLYYKYLIQEKRCTAKTIGTVIRYTLATCGGENSPVCLPVVSYTVNGETYKAVGPEVQRL